MKSVYNLKTLNFNSNWNRVNFRINGTLVAIGAEYVLNNSHFTIEPKVDRIGGYAIIYDGRIIYTKNAFELIKVLSFHFQTFFKNNL